MKYLLCLFVLFAVGVNAQQASPTQPIIFIQHPKPDPDFSSCHSQTHVCASVPTDSNTLSDYCLTDSEYFSNYPSGQAACGDISEMKSIECFSCSCPSGQVRIDHICVPDQSCPVGVQDFVTGACYDMSCPFGDGSAENCSHPPKCVVSEDTTLIIDANNNASCQCTGNKIWDSFEYTCHLPRCNGDFGSPYGSVFDENSAVCVCPSQTVLDAETNTCVSTNCPAGQIFVGNTHQCEVAATCPFGFDIKSQDNSCYDPHSGTHNCSQVDFDINRWKEAMSSDECVFPPHQVPAQLPPGCLFINGAVQSQIDAEFDNRQYCQSCSTPPNFVDIAYEPPNGVNVYKYYARCLNAPTFCNSRGGIWRTDLNRCVDGLLQPSITNHSLSSSSSSLFSASSSSISSSSISSSSSSSAASNAGGAGGSSGSNNSTGGGGDGGNNGDGSGGGTGSAGSVASVANSSLGASVVSSVSNSATSTAHSTITSSGSGSSVTGSSGSNTSSGSGASSGSNNSSGGGGTGGTGGSSGNQGSAGSQGNNSSANTSSGVYKPMTGEGKFDESVSAQLTAELTAQLRAKIDSIKAEIQAEAGLNLSSTATLQDICWDVRGHEVCAGLSKYPQYIDVIGKALLFMTSCIAFFVVVRK